MWEIEGFKALAAKPGVHMHSLQLCMFGGTRPKWSAFPINIPEFWSQPEHAMARQLAEAI